MGIFRRVPFLAEVADHGLDVGEGALSSLSPPLGLLHSLGLIGDLLASFSRQVLHVSLHKLNLRIQILVALISVLKLLLQLEVLHFKLVDSPLILLFAVS